MIEKIKIMAISEYYNIPIRVAKIKYEIMDKKEIEQIISWWNARHNKEV